MFERATIQGLSGTKKETVEKFETHIVIVEMMNMVKDLLNDKSLFEGLKNDALSALELTEKEKLERNRAVESIAKAEKETADLRNLSIQLDAKKTEIENKEKASLENIEDMRQKAMAAIDTKKSGLDIQNAKTVEKLNDIEKSLLEKAQELTRDEERIRKLNAELDEKKKSLTDLHDKLTERHDDLTARSNDLMDREKALIAQSK